MGSWSPVLILVSHREVEALKVIPCDDLQVALKVGSA
jgi:hypothetical protein